MGTVYAIRNKVTGRIYVGRSVVLKGLRPHKHFIELKAHRHKVDLMQNDFDKYGEQSFEVKYLGEYEGNKLKQMEVFMMKVLRTQDARFGYNYKDKIGTSKFSAEDRWRTAPISWHSGTRGLFPLSKEVAV